MKIAALFPGYGSQFVGMAKELYDNSRLIQEHFEQASNCLDINFVKLCFASSDYEISKMNNAFPALFLVSSSIFDLLKQEGLEVDLVAGHGVGQYAALHAADSLSLPDGLYLLNKYVNMYHELLEHHDLSFIKVFDLATKDVEQVCKKYNTAQTPVNIAVYDSETEHTIVGDKKAVKQVANDLIDLEGTTDVVGYEVGLHSDAMKTIADTFSMYLAKVDFNDASTQLLCNVDLKKINTGKDLQACAVSWITKPVYWAQVLDNLIDYDLIIQIGPGTTLNDMIVKQYPDKKIITINNWDDITALKEMLGIKKETQEVEE
ncbi:ACP S-malonyltransferase [bacterium]|nr:ACP S-malonyltransferase [bacterium]